MRQDVYKSNPLFHHAVPPLVSISLTSQDVPVGGEVGVTCTAVEGYPLPTEISLFHPGGVAVVQNGQVYPLKNLSIKDSGELQCVLSDVSGQLRAAAQLNVFSKLPTYPPLVHIYVL